MDQSGLSRYTDEMRLTGIHLLNCKAPAVFSQGSDITTTTIKTQITPG